MAIAPGTRLGAYEVLSALGAGGMGEVYRARDTRLKRDVAIKVLPDTFTTDPERLARFQREAEVLATLNHPNIAQIHGYEDTRAALVLELVEGPTLADRIDHGPIPLEEALPIARQIADALEAAHEHGIIHRDLKPANIKLADDGRVKVLDFGLAKALAAGPRSAAGDPAEMPHAGVSQSPTLASPVYAGHDYGDLRSMPGVILGTAAYMSPEQARGRPVDRRADVWAFGCVLYEMLTGTRAFGGETVTETLASVLKTDPDWTVLPHDTPEPVQRLLRRCLAKDPRLRLSDASALRLDIDEALTWKRPAPVTAAPKSSRRASLAAWTIAALSVMAVAATAALYQPVGVEPPAQVQFTFEPPPGTSFPSGDRVPWSALSPDGRHLAFTAFEANGDPSLWIRRLDSVEFRRIASPATMMFWSPDSRAIAYQASGNLMRAELSGGTAQMIGRLPGTMGGSWNSDGTLLIGGNRTGVHRLSGGGAGESTLATILDTTRDISHRHPFFLPDGRHFLYTGYHERKIYVASLDGGPPSAVVNGDSQAVYASGHLLVVRDGILEAHPFDLNTLKIAGDPIVLARGMVSNYGLRAQFAVSTNGVLMYRATSGTDQYRIAWMGRDGKPLGLPAVPDGEYRQLALSPDGRYLAISRRMPNGSGNIWLAEVARGVLSRFTSGDMVEDDSFWSPDSRRLGFTRAQRMIVEKALAGGAERTLVGSFNEAYGEHFSPDGRLLAFGTGGTIFIQPVSPPGEAFRLIEQPAPKDEPRFSPDSQWIAYYSLESGRPEVYAKTVSGTGERIRISTDGGSQPRWRSDGREMFYLDLEGRIMAVPLRVTATTLEPGVPVALFKTPIREVAINIDQYDASADGQRFVIIAPVPDSIQPPMTVVVNWSGRRDE